jgi:glycosyltransferase involved in cell wall biosynthesis
LTGRAIRRVALVEPVGDVGIGGYTHELAEGLEANGVRVTMYSRPDTLLLRFPRTYRLLPVLGAHPLATEPAAAPPAPPLAVAEAGRSLLDPYFDLLERRAAAPAPAAAPVAAPVAAPAAPAPEPGSPERSAELARHIADGGYDLVWTQWPAMRGYGPDFFRALRALELPLAHTVHNVLPHERAPGDVELCGEVYAAADRLVVHSHAAAAALGGTFPETRGRIVPSHHGLYTLFPRAPAVRERVRGRLGVADGETVFLFFGGVRPYKNVDAALEAMADPRADGTRLVVAGWEWGYPDAVAGDRLGRTRRRARELGVADRVTLLPGPFGVPQAAELFEAADSVVLPYVESSGSGVLLLAMTFGKHVLATAAGGMDEYLGGYPMHTLLPGTAPGQVAAGMAEARSTVAGPQRPATIGALEWPAIVRALLPALAR